jgi:hypothetical protein
MEELQQVLDNLCKGADNWGMCFNAGKCKRMNIGKDNLRHKDYMKGTLLGTTEEVKDIGVNINQH